MIFAASVSFWLKKSSSCSALVATVQNGTSWPLMVMVVWYALCTVTTSWFFSMLVGLVDSTRSCVLIFTPCSCSNRSTLIAYVVTVVVSPLTVNATDLRAPMPNANADVRVSAATHVMTRTRRSVTNLLGVHLLAMRPLSSIVDNIVIVAIQPDCPSLFFLDFLRTDAFAFD